MARVIFLNTNIPTENDMQLYVVHLRHAISNKLKAGIKSIDMCLTLLQNMSLYSLQACHKHTGMP